MQSLLLTPPQKRCLLSAAPCLSFVAELPMDVSSRHPTQSAESTGLLDRSTSAIAFAAIRVDAVGCAMGKKS